MIIEIRKVDLEKEEEIVKLRSSESSEVESDTSSSSGESS